MSENYCKEVIAFSEQVHKKWKKKLKQYGILYLYAMSGYGKSVQAITFAEKEYKSWKRIEVKKDFFECIDSYLDEVKGKKTKSLLILDDLQWLYETKRQNLLLEKMMYIQKNSKNVDIFLISRAKLPEYLTVLKLTKQLAIEDISDLDLDEEMVETIVNASELEKKRPELFVDSSKIQNKITNICYKISRGYPIALNAFIDRLMEPNTDIETAHSLGHKDMLLYFEHHICNLWNSKYSEAMIRLSICDTFDDELARIILGDDAENIIKEINRIGSFLTVNASEVWEIHPIFLGFLREKFQELPEKERCSLYETAGKYFEKKRHMLKALECYKRGKLFKPMLNIIYYLGENLDGYGFSRTCYESMKELPVESEERFPRVLALKSVVYAYHMELEKSDEYMRRLRAKMQEEKKNKIGTEALNSYIHASINLSRRSSQKALKYLKFLPDYARRKKIDLNYCLPTGNMPSIISGAIDLLDWTRKSESIYSWLKEKAEGDYGTEMVGLADVFMGEQTYEKNQMTKSISYLTKGLSEANLRGSIPMQFTATAIMGKVFCVDGQWDTADGILNNIRDKAMREGYFELLPNIEATIAEVHLFLGDNEFCQKWCGTTKTNEYDDFFVAEQYELFVKAKYYIFQGRNMEAISIIEKLREYANKYKRFYFAIELQVLEAICLYRSKSEWEDIFLKAVKEAEAYQCVRVIANYGKAILPLWEQVETKFESLDDCYTKSVLNELKKMAEFYPKYLEVPRAFDTITKREIEVLKLIADGLNNQKIAKEMKISLGTVKFHISNILKKLQVENRISAVRIARQEGLLK